MKKITPYTRIAEAQTRARKEDEYSQLTLPEGTTTTTAVVIRKKVK